MILYIAIFLFIFFLAAAEQIVDKKYLETFRGIVLIGLILVTTFRSPDISKDYYAYVQNFFKVEEPSNYFTNYLEWGFYEPTFYLIPSFYKTYISNDDHNYILLTFFTYALIAICLKFKALSKVSHYFFLSVLVYFSNFFILHEMTQIRAGIATGFVMLSVYILKQRKRKVFACLVLLSLLFHFSSIAMVVLFFLNPDKMNKKLYLGLLAATLVFAFIDMNFIFTYIDSFNLGPLNSKAAAYVDNLDDEGGKTNKLNVLFLVNYAVTVILMLYYERIQAQNKYATLAIKMQVISMFTFQLFSAIPGFAFRFSELFLTVQPITFPFMVHAFRNRWVGFLVVTIWAVGSLAVYLTSYLEF